jgi:hypothetical protein
VAEPTEPPPETSPDGRAKPPPPSPGDAGPSPAVRLAAAVAGGAGAAFGMLQAWRLMARLSGPGSAVDAAEAAGPFAGAAAVMAGVAIAVVCLRRVLAPGAPGAADPRFIPASLAVLVAATATVAGAFRLRDDPAAGGAIAPTGSTTARGGASTPAASPGTSAVRVEPDASASIEDLIRRLGDPDAKVRAAAAEALCNRDGDISPAAGPLLDRLKDADADVRKWSAAALGQTGKSPPGAAAVLAELLRGDPDVTVRDAAAFALERVGEGPPEAVAALTAGLGDKARGVRARCCRSLGGLGAGPSPPRPRWPPG